MLRNLVIGRYLSFYKYHRTKLNAYLEIYSSESFFLFWRGIQKSSLVIEIMIQKNLKNLEKLEVWTTSRMKVFLGNKYDSYIHTARNFY